MENILGGDLLVVLEVSEVVDLVHSIVEHFAENEEEGAVEVIGWFRSKAGDSERTRGIEVKLWRGNGVAVAHSSERP